MNDEVEVVIIELFSVETIFVEWDDEDEEEGVAEELDLNGFKTGIGLLFWGKKLVVVDLDDIFESWCFDVCEIELRERVEGNNFEDEDNDKDDDNDNDNDGDNFETERGFAFGLLRSALAISVCCFNCEDISSSICCWTTSLQSHFPIRFKLFSFIAV